MKKYKYFINFEKEEKWLMEMAKQGFLLENRSFGYRFRRVEPEEAIIKVDFRKFNNKEDFLDYCTLFEDSGWKHIVGDRKSGYQYFKSMDKRETDDIFSDSVSKAGKYYRLSKMFMDLAMGYLFIVIIMNYIGIINVDAIFNPKLLYFTPGLWEMTGIAFLAAFLFESPFALGRGFAWAFFPITMILYVIFAIKAKRLYELNRK